MAQADISDKIVGAKEVAGDDNVKNASKPERISDVSEHPKDVNPVDKEATPIKKATSFFGASPAKSSKSKDPKHDELIKGNGGAFKPISSDEVIEQLKDDLVKDLKKIGDSVKESSKDINQEKVLDESPEKLQTENTVTENTAPPEGVSPSKPKEQNEPEKVASTEPLVPGTNPKEAASVPSEQPVTINQF